MNQGFGPSAFYSPNPQGHKGGLQVKEGKMRESAVIFMGEFVRISEDGADGKNSNTYCDWRGIGTIRTCGSEE